LARKHSCFVTWHYQTRSRSLARELDLPLMECQIEGPGWWRHLVSSFWTIGVLIRRHPRTIVIQYSYFLMLIVCLYKLLRLSRVCLVADCHNKALHRSIGGSFGRLFWAVKRWTFNRANIVIVSNISLLNDVPGKPSRILVLADPLPNLDHHNGHRPEGTYCVIVSSFAADEPVEEMLGSIDCLESDVKIYWTGRVPPRLARRYHDHPRLTFTSYVPDDEYRALITGAACIVALTTEEGCLLSSAYEGIAAGVPLVLSGTRALREFFAGAALYTDNTAPDIAACIDRAVSDGAAMTAQVNQLRGIIRCRIQGQLKALESFLMT
jgi:glycosyltransferase involved in cell wall biosynthesis